MRSSQPYSAMRWQSPYQRSAQAYGKDAKIHIKLDTGMNRIGFKPTQESVDIIENF